jgi:hypothetical protein
MRRCEYYIYRIKYKHEEVERDYIEFRKEVEKEEHGNGEKQRKKPDNGRDSETNK